jgi:lipoprotein-anchoring transpeptidase ErfK/SrfK
MNRTIRLAAVLAVLAAAAPAESLLAQSKKKKAAARKPAAVSLDAKVVNDAATAPLVKRGSSGGGVLRAQVLLDRARFSPGEIDGTFGSNVEKAIAGFQKAHGVEPSGVVDAATWKLLNADATPVLAKYELTAEDVAGPFEAIPEDMMEKSKLATLGYSSTLEALGEKFHSSPKLLTRLNPGTTFNRAGEEVIVPSVRSAAPPKVVKVVVDDSDKTLSAWDAGDKLIAQYPATTGSEHDPLPVGSWKINGVSRNPAFHYNPDLFWDADESHAKAKIPAGPNNPVGVVWIDLSKPHYGIHGTPEPATIGKTQSHGCIRLTNWDAAELAEMVTPGTPAVLQE